MFRNGIYYQIKPMLPPSVRRGARRWLARRKLKQVESNWPILPGSEKPPEGWSGWPNGSQFALVLTHDVEGKLGLNKCWRLMDLEMKLGFRSSFNFVPEGEYRVPCELRQELERNGFEVGVHDLHHNGKLYRSCGAFSKNAELINHYLNEWGAVGFRSAFMLHRLDWLHKLNILYEASTFDTDPFEPQPDGVSTIFPFWVPGPIAGVASAKCTQEAGARSGYIELPYTLPQDSTLFLVLGETELDVWLKKLEWVAKHGGMVLVNTHPDYMAMNALQKGDWEYPVEQYVRFLEQVKQQYEGAYWHALPREVANYCLHVLSQAPRETWMKAIAGRNGK